LRGCHTRAIGHADLDIVRKLRPEDEMTAR
jgi:hypothetical protein